MSERRSSSDKRLFSEEVAERRGAPALNFATSKSMFRARLPSIFNTCHKMPRLPRNLHLVAT